MKSPAGSLGNGAGLDDLIVGQIEVFKDDLQQRAALMRRLSDLGQLVLHIVIFTGKEAADVHDNVALHCALGDGVLGLENLGLGRAGAVREPDDGGRKHLGPLQFLTNNGQIRRTDADGDGLIFFRQLAAFLQRLNGDIRAEQRMVEYVGDVLNGNHFLRHRELPFFLACTGGHRILLNPRRLRRGLFTFSLRRSWRVLSSRPLSSRCQA